MPRALGQGADGITHEEVPWSLPGSEKCKRKARDSGWDLLPYFQCFYHNNTPPTPRANKSKKRTHKNRCFFFHSSPQRSTWSTQNSSGMQSCTSGGFSGATRTPSSVSSTVNPAGLPAKSRILRRERSWKSWNEIKWTPVVWHSWLENHPSPFLPTPIRNKTSSRFKKMRNSLDLMAWNYHGLKVDQNPSWENMRDPGPLVVVSHEMDSNLRRFVTARFGALFDFI